MMELDFAEGLYSNKNRLTDWMVKNMELKFDKRKICNKGIISFISQMR